MKILCLSDYVDPLIYNPNVKEIFPDIDLILCAGDLPMDYVDYVVTMFNKPTYFIFGNHNLNDYGMYHPESRSGDQYMKIRDSAEHGHGATYLGFKTETNHNLTFVDPETGKVTPLLIAGISGTVKYNRGLNQYSEKHMKFKLWKLGLKLTMNKIRYGRYLDIFLTHASPRHIHDKEDPCHIGFDCFNDFLKKYKPTYMVHGHIHLYDMREERIGKYFDTTVVNAYAHCVIELPATSDSISDSQN